MNLLEKILCWWTHRVHVETSDSVADQLMQGSMQWHTYVCKSCGKRYCYTYGSRYL